MFVTDEETDVEEGKTGCCPVSLLENACRVRRHTWTGWAGLGKVAVIIDAQAVVVSHVSAGSID